MKVFAAASLALLLAACAADAPEPTTSVVSTQPPLHAEVRPTPPPARPHQAQREPRAVRISFATDSAELTFDSRQKLRRTAQFLQQNNVADILIQGHTDARGEAGYNDKLAGERAKSVADYLRGLGIASNRIGTSSRGETQPACNDGGADCLAQNRRAVVWIDTRP